MSGCLLWNSGIRGSSHSTAKAGDVVTWTGLSAAVYPVWLAARLPIAATLRDEVVG